MIGQKQLEPGNSFSGLGGSNASFEALRALFILSRQTIDVIGLSGLTPVTVLNGKHVAGDVDCNKKGAMLSDTMLRWARAHVSSRQICKIKVTLTLLFIRVNRYVNNCIEPFIEPPISKEDPGVFICDGVGVHMTPDFIEYMINTGWILVLRTPFCSDVQQGEDLVSFWALK